jgi:predicted rRNA methylase YqxC with S4 and FtsJ domains
MKITHKKLNDSVEFSIEDEINHLGVKFVTPDLSDISLDKILSTIADYINANYACLHQKKDRGVTFVK